MRRRLLCLALICCCALSFAAEVPHFDVVVSTHPKCTALLEGRRAYLRLPRGGSEVKAVLYCHQNMTEEVLFRSCIFTSAMDSLGVAMAFIQGGSQNWDLSVRDSSGFNCQDRFNAVMSRFAAESGYPELEAVPVIPFGHSAQATFPWNFAAFNPGRVLCIISYHGDAPRTNPCGYGRANVEWGRTANIDRIPGLMIEGEYEWWEARVNPALAFRMMYPDSRISFLCDAQRGHFDLCEDTQRYIATFISKALSYNGEDGVLFSRWYADGHTSEDPHDCFWYFDDAMRDWTARRYRESLGKKMQYVSARLNGKSLVYNPDSHIKMNIKMNCSSSDEILHFEPCFVDQTRNRSCDAHADVKPRVVLISGPAVQIGENRFRVNADYFGKDPSRLWRGITFCVEAEGDAQYKCAVQEINVTVNLE